MTLKTTFRKCKFFFGASALLAIFMILSGCGGGGQSSTSQSVPNLPPVGISLLAGSIGGNGNINGNGATARFQQPNSVAIDKAGNIFVTDTIDSTIRRIAPTGDVSVFAGLSGVAGSVDGAGSAANFNSPKGIAVDSVGNLYVADYFNRTIRKISPTGVVTTLAGKTGIAGATDGPSDAARFYRPVGIAVDGSGNVYVSDDGDEAPETPKTGFGNTIRKISPTGVVTTLAGAAGVMGSQDGSGASATFNQPQGLAVDAAGNVYVSDFNAVRKITPTGVVTTLFKGDQNNFVGGSVAIDSAGTLYFPIGAAIVKFAASSGTSTLAGNISAVGSNDGNGVNARFNSDLGLTLDSTGNVYVADRLNNTIRKVALNGNVSTIAGSAAIASTVDGVGAAAGFYFPQDLTVDGSGNTYVANGAIRKIDATGVVTTLPGISDSIGVAVDIGGTLYVMGSTTIRKITSSGAVTTLTDNFGNVIGISGRGIAVDRNGVVYVADTNNHVIRKIASNGVVTILAGSVGNAGAIDGTGDAARFNLPYRLTLDVAGNLYVVDSGNKTIRKVTSTGTVTTIAGNPSVSSSMDGIGTSATFSRPQGITIDKSGNLYVTDGDTFFTLGGGGNHLIRKITPDGIVTTIAGQLNSDGIALGGLPGSLGGVKGISIDANDVLYVAAENAVIRVRLK
jgi:sugar lactone lactonase YvrE